MGYYYTNTDQLYDDDGNPVKCAGCGAFVEYDKDSERLIFDCPCGEVNPEDLPEWIK